MTRTEVLSPAFVAVSLALAAAFLVVAHAGITESDGLFFAALARPHYKFFAARFLFLGGIAFEVAY